MIFDKDIDDVLNVLITTSGKNSLEITKFIKNLPNDFIELINDSINSLEKGENKNLTYSKSNNWNYYCNIEKNELEKKLYIGMYAKGDVNPLFYVSINSNYNDSLHNLKNYSVTLLGSSGFTANNKRYSINYYLKKFPSEYMIISEAIKYGSNNSSRYHNYINISKISRELYRDDLDGIIYNKLKVMERKRNKY